MDGVDVPPFAPTGEEVPARFKRVIGHDVHRTFTGLLQATFGHFHSLQSILEFYALFNGSIGYTQGMNFLAAVPLTVMPATEAFETFFGIMHNPNIGMSSFYEDGLPGFFTCANVWLRLLQTRYPGLHLRMMAGNTVTPQLTVARPFQSLIVSLVVPLELKFIMFDRVIIHGKAALVSFALMIASIFKRKLRTMAPDEVQNLFLHMDQDQIFTDVPFVVRKWNRNWVSEAEYQAALREVE
jgi:hypothetical protein